MANGNAIQDEEQTLQEKIRDSFEQKVIKNATDEALGIVQQGGATPEELMSKMDQGIMQRKAQAQDPSVILTELLTGTREPRPSDIQILQNAQFQVPVAPTAGKPWDSKKGLTSAIKDVVRGEGWTFGQPKMKNVSLQPNQIVDLLQSGIRESRLSQQQERLNRQEKVKNFEKFGTVVAAGEIPTIAEETGANFQSVIEAYGIEPREINGERQYIIPPEPVLKEMAQRQTITAGEQEYFDSKLEGMNRFQEALDIAKKLNISREQLRGLNIVQETYQTNVGPISLPARFEVLRQFRNDRDLQQLAGKLDRAFQVYRKAVTGAQASVTELNLLRPLMPNILSRPEILLDTIDQVVNEGSIDMNRRLDLMQSVGRDVKKLRASVERGSRGMTEPMTGTRTSTGMQKPKVGKQGQAFLKSIGYKGA